MSEDEPNDGNNRRHRDSKKSCQKQIRKRFPILSWLPNYKRSDLAADIIAGVTVALTLVPQSMAYAAIAGLSPEYGLYSGYIGVFLYVILGSCKQVTIGPTAVMGLLTYETCGNDFPSCAILTGFYAGIFEILMAVLQLGWVVHFISDSVVIGFTAGAASTIISSQVKSFLGISGPKGKGLIGYWRAIFRDINSISFADCSMGILSFITLLLLRELKDYKHPRNKIITKVCWLISVSRNVIVVMITSFIAFAWENPPFELTGHVHGGFPDIDIPSFNLPLPFNFTNPDDMASSSQTEKMTFWETWSFIGAGPLIVALIAVLQNVAISKAFGVGQTIDATQEMFALGIANIVGSFFSSIPISGSFSRSAVNESSGVRSPMGGLFTGILVLLSLGFLTQSFYFIPKSSMAAVIICAVMFMIEFESLSVMWKVNKFDLATCIVTYICSITLGLEYGIMIGVATSIAVILIKMLKPDLEAVIFSDECTNLKYIYSKPSHGIHFPSVDHLRTSLSKISRTNEEIDIIVLNLENWETVDYTTVLALKSLSVSLNKERKILIFSNLSSDLQEALQAVGIHNDTLCPDSNVADCIKKSFVFESLFDDDHNMTKTNLLSVKYSKDGVDDTDQVEENETNTKVQISESNDAKPFLS